MTDKPFILQRQVTDGHRELWFDAKGYGTAEAANQALRWERDSERARIYGAGGANWSGQRAQRIRVVQVSATPTP